MKLRNILVGLSLVAASCTAPAYAMSPVEVNNQVPCTSATEMVSILSNTYGESIISYEEDSPREGWINVYFLNRQTGSWSRVHLSPSQNIACLIEYGILGPEARN